MKVSILCPDLSENCLGRAQILAQVLARRYAVEIVGPAFGGSIWEPAAGLGLPLKAVPMEPRTAQAGRLACVLARADGDLLYASKPLLASFGLGLLGKLRSGRPLLLDVDDWELGFARAAWRGLSGWRRLRHLAASTARPHLNHGFWNIRACERLTGLADARTVSNRFLQRRYGGTLVPHGRDTGRFRPQAVDARAARLRAGIDPDARVVLYLGTLRPHKGVDVLIRAVQRIDRPDLRLLLVGVDDPRGATLSEARQRLGPRLLWRGPQPFDAVPEFLALADVVAVPQLDSPATVGQLPAKLFDAMAMARPIVASAVSDIPEALDGCGWLVRPGSEVDLAAALQQVLADEAEALRRGALARARCVERFSWDAMEASLGPLLARYEMALDGLPSAARLHSPRRARNRR